MTSHWRPITLRGLVALCQRGWWWRADRGQPLRLISPDGRPFDFRADRGQPPQIRESVDLAQLATGEGGVRA